MRERGRGQGGTVQLANGSSLVLLPAPPPPSTSSSHVLGRILMPRERLDDLGRGLVRSTTTMTPSLPPSSLAHPPYLSLQRAPGPTPRVARSVAEELAALAPPPRERPAPRLGLLADEEPVLALAAHLRRLVLGAVHGRADLLRACARAAGREEGEDGRGEGGGRGRGGGEEGGPQRGEEGPRAARAEEGRSRAGCRRCWCCWYGCAREESRGLRAGGGEGGPRRRGERASEAGHGGCGGCCCAAGGWTRRVLSREWCGWAAIPPSRARRRRDEVAHLVAALGAQRVARCDAGYSLSALCSSQPGSRPTRLLLFLSASLELSLQDQDYTDAETLQR